MHIFIALSIHCFLVNSVISFEGWVISTILSCVLIDPDSTRNSLHHLSKCVQNKTQHCIKDQSDYSVNIIHMNTYCALIDSNAVKKFPTTWTLSSLPTISLHILEFNIYTTNIVCESHHLVLIDNDVEHKLCNRFHPFTYDSSHSSLKLVYENTKSSSDTAVFKLQYHGVPYFPIFKENIDIDPMPWEIGQGEYMLQFQDNLEAHFHINNYIISRAIKLTINPCESQVYVYDGPGFKSPLLGIHTVSSERVFYSTSYQVFLVFQSPTKIENSCKKKIKYIEQVLKKSLRNTNCRIKKGSKWQHDETFSFIPTSTTKNVRCWFKYDRYETEVIQLNIKKVKFVGAQLYLGGPRCSFGGAFATSFGKYRHWFGCPGELDNVESFPLYFQDASIEVLALSFAGYSYINALEGEVYNTYERLSFIMLNSVGFAFPIENDKVIIDQDLRHDKISNWGVTSHVQFLAPLKVDSKITSVEILFHHYRGLAVQSKLKLASQDLKLLNNKQPYKTCVALISESSDIQSNFYNLKAKFISRFHEGKSTPLKSLTLNFSECNSSFMPYWSLELRIQYVDYNIINSVFDMLVNSTEGNMVRIYNRREFKQGQNYSYALYLHGDRTSKDHATIINVQRFEGCKINRIFVEYIEGNRSMFYKWDRNASQVAAPFKIVLRCDPCAFHLFSQSNFVEENCDEKFFRFYAYVTQEYLPVKPHVKVSSIFKTKFINHGNR